MPDRGREQPRTEIGKLRAQLRDKTRLNRDTGCHTWIGAGHPRGYGQMHWRGRNLLAHRLAYEAYVGPIPDGLVIDHLCENKLCVNPAHLEAVTSEANTRRSPNTTASRNAAKTHCPQGHEYTPENTVIRDQPGGRRRLCATRSAATTAARSTETLTATRSHAPGAGADKRSRTDDNALRGR